MFSWDRSRLVEIVDLFNRCASHQFKPANKDIALVFSFKFVDI